MNNTVRYAVGLPTVGEFGHPKVLLRLAKEAEAHGWDGVHLWDHVRYHEPDWPVTSSVVAAAAIATATERLRIILTVALPRRQFQDIAQDIKALNEVSEGRLTIVATIGSMDSEYSAYGLDPDPKARGRALDELLPRLEVPIWCGGKWPHRAGLRRAARFDGAMPTFENQRQRNVSVAEFAAAAALVEGKDIALEGATEGPGDDLSSYAQAGMTWWIEALGWWRGGVQSGLDRIRKGHGKVK